MRAAWPQAIAFTRGSNQFVGDVVLGVIAALHFLAADSLGMRVLLNCEKAIRYLVSVTFSMYVSTCRWLSWSGTCSACMRRRRSSACCWALPAWAS
jgi:hypothetical protein